MLLHGNVSIALRSPLRLTTSSNSPRSFAISAQLPIKSDYSISDDDLESRGFNLRRSIADLNIDHLNKVFVAVGFPRRDPDKVRVALENTDSLLWIEYEKTKRPVAFARATGDGVFNAIIWDVVVDPSFQGIGLGKAVMERLVTELLRKGITNIALYSEPRVLGFYRPLGFLSESESSDHPANNHPMPTQFSTVGSSSHGPKLFNRNDLIFGFEIIQTLPLTKFSLITKYPPLYDYPRPQLPISRSPSFTLLSLSSVLSPSKPAQT